MKITIKATGTMRRLFASGKDGVTVEIDSPKTVREILVEELGIDPGIVMAVIVNGQYRKRDYTPTDGDEITLVYPLGGG